MPYVKMTFSLPEDLTDRLKKRVPAAELSSFVADAIAAQLEEAVFDYDDTEDDGDSGDSGGDS